MDAARPRSRVAPTPVDGDGSADGPEAARAVAEVAAEPAVAGEGEPS